MSSLGLLLAFCASFSAVMATPFMPRFPNIEASQPVLVESSSQGSGVTWIAGSSDKSAYIGRCQRLTIKVAPEYLPQFPDGGQVAFQFTCFGDRNSIASQVVLVNTSRNSTSNATATICSTIKPAVQLVTLNATDFQLVLPDCSNNRLLTSSAAVESIQGMEIRLILNVSAGKHSLQSKNLTVRFLSPFANLAGPETADGNRLITKAAIDLIVSQLRAGKADESLLRVSFLEKQVLKTIRTLPLYLRTRMQIGIVITAADCSTFSLNASVALIANYYQSLNLTSTKASTQHSCLFSRSDAYYVDLESGTLYLSGANLLAKVASIWSKESRINLRLCEYLQFARHGGSASSTEVAVSEWLAPAFLPPVPVQRCQAVLAAQGMLMEVLHDSSGPAIVACPFVCAPTNAPTECGCQARALSLSSALPPFNLRSINPVEKYHCKSDSSLTVSVKARTLTRFLSGSLSLPASIFAMEGESLSYSCSAVSSAVPSQNGSTPAAIMPVIYVPAITGRKANRVITWTRRHLSANGSVLAVTRTVARETSQSTSIVETVTVTVLVVPPANDSGNFTHRFACQLTAHPGEAGRLYGMRSYASEVGTDVVFVPRPTDESFTMEAINETTFKFTLHPLFAAYLAEAGAQVSAAFRLEDRWLNASHPLVRAGLFSTAFQAASGSLLLTVGSWQQRPQIGTECRRRLVAVFSFRYPEFASLGSLLLDRRTAVSRHPRRLLGSALCATDPRCFYTTDYDAEAVAGAEEDSRAQLRQMLTVNLDFCQTAGQDVRT